MRLAYLIIFVIIPTNSEGSSSPGLRSEIKAPVYLGRVFCRWKAQKNHLFGGFLMSIRGFPQTHPRIILLY